jgi:hypothetical protein
MKNVILSFAVIVSVLAVSCKKEKVEKPQSSSPAAPVSINIEYKIVSESANVEATYLFPNAENKLESKTETITRSDYSVKFTAKKGDLLSVEASNVNPARKSIHVQIIVNDVLFMEASSSSASQKAIASGNY